MIGEYDDKGFEIYGVLTSKSEAKKMCSFKSLSADMGEKYKVIKSVLFSNMN